MTRRVLALCSLIPKTASAPVNAQAARVCELGCRESLRLHREPAHPWRVQSRRRLPRLDAQDRSSHDFSSVLTTGRRGFHARAVQRNLHLARSIHAPHQLRAGVSRRLAPSAVQCLVRGLRRNRAPVDRRPNGATVPHRARASAARSQGNLPLPHCLGREVECLRNVLSFQIRIRFEDFVDGKAIRNHLDNYRNWDSQTPDAWGAPELIGSNGDARELHDPRIASIAGPIGRLVL